MYTDLYMHSVYYSMMLLEGTNYDSYFPCTPEGTNYDYYCPPGSIVKVLEVGYIHSYCRSCIYVMLFDEMYTFTHTFLNKYDS